MGACRKCGNASVTLCWRTFNNSTKLLTSWWSWTWVCQALVTRKLKSQLNVAVVLKKVKEGETHFQYKNVDANKWCLFKAFRVQSEVVWWVRWTLFLHLLPVTQNHRGILWLLVVMSFAMVKKGSAFFLIHGSGWEVFVWSAFLSKEKCRLQNLADNLLQELFALNFYVHFGLLGNGFISFLLPITPFGGGQLTWDGHSTGLLATVNSL
mgnify:CR=1 FL=1